MAFYLTNLSTHALFSLVSLIFLLLATNALSFNFTKLSLADSKTILQGDAKTLPTGFLALTNNRLPARTFPTTGRALFESPVTLWDKATGDVASFITSFSFAVESHKGRGETDGLIFFIAPPDTVIPNNSESQYLGVVNSKSSINQFVGVEFDLYSNPFDPPMKHIGIDVNSLISLKTELWKWVSGSLTKVTIRYDSPSNLLSVVVNYANGDSSTIAQAVDLKTVLPNIVRIGISATSTVGVAHNIRSWSFETTRSVSDI